MKKLLKTCKSPLLDQTGTSATEYGVIIAGVALALIFVFFTITGAFDRGFEVIVNTLTNAVNR